MDGPENILSSLGQIFTEKGNPTYGSLKPSAREQFYPIRSTFQEAIEQSYPVIRCKGPQNIPQFIIRKKPTDRETDRHTDDA